MVESLTVRFIAFSVRGLPVTNVLLLGICALDFLGNDPDPNANTPGLIVDEVSYLEQQFCLPANSFDFKDHT